MSFLEWCYVKNANIKREPNSEHNNYNNNEEDMTTTTTMEWTREKTLALIQEYRNRRGLWDMTHEDYRKKDVKQKLLVEVSETLAGNIPIMEIEKKFHTLRTQYHREINRMKRKEPYNSKWFGFKYLQFLSSPKACRSNKGRIKAEITEEGIVTTKYIIREAIQPGGHDTTSAGSGNDNEEFLTLQRGPTTTITYETGPASGEGSTVSSRSHELEKLIEETTKDVDEIEDSKPKILKEITHVPMEHQHHADTYAAEELQITSVESEHQDLHHIEDADANMEVMQMQQEEVLNYQTATSNHGVTTVSTVNAGHTQSSSSAAASTTTTVHAIPTRIIKIQRRDTHDDSNGDYYEQHHQQPQQRHHHHSHQQQQQHQQHHHIQTVSPSSSNSTTTTTKRIYYDPSGHHTTTILTSNPHQQQTSGVSIINAATSSMSTSPTSKLHLRNNLIMGSGLTTPLSSTTLNAAAASSPAAAATSAMRDEYAIFGEYVANEMREIKSREILLTLKHKINNALFEANMQELQK